MEFIVLFFSVSFLPLFARLIHVGSFSESTNWQEKRKQKQKEINKKTTNQKTGEEKITD
jgi:hypothetical protein